MRRTVFGLLCAAAAACAAQGQALTPSQTDEAVRGAFADVATEIRLEHCFANARLMMFGAYSKEKNRPIEVYVQSGVLPKDSSEFGHVARGYKMNGFMGSEAKEYFLTCMKDALHQ